MSDSAFLDEEPDVGRQAAGNWWLWLVVGIAWIVAALVILQFDQASIATVGVIVGYLCSLAAALQQFVLAAIADSLRWLLGDLRRALRRQRRCICFISPENTFAALADILGFLFLFGRRCGG